MSIASQPELDRRSIVDHDARVQAANRAIAVAFAPLEGTTAEDMVRRYAHGHYENFSVLSMLVPRAIRQDFANLYAFCRAADDLGDETDGPATALRHLAALRASLTACYAGRPTGAVFTALRSTIDRHNIPIDPFLDLISAFEQDQRVNRYDTFEQLLDYCRRSADPVGRLVLYVCGHRDERRQSLSNRTCTALQLANFWQDARRDFIDLDRIYFPSEWIRTFGVEVSQFSGARADDKFKAMVRHAVDRTEAMFCEGDALLPTLSRPIAAHISLFAAGGRAILAAIRAQEYDTIVRRPTLSRLSKARLIGRVAGARMLTLTLGIGSRP